MIEQFQKHSVMAVQLNEIVRQKNPDYHRVVVQVSQAKIAEAVQDLNACGRVIEISDDRNRTAAIARERPYARHLSGKRKVSSAQRGDSGRDAPRHSQNLTEGQGRAGRDSSP